MTTLAIQFSDPYSAASMYRRNMEAKLAHQVRMARHWFDELHELRRYVAATCGVEKCRRCGG